MGMGMGGMMPGQQQRMPGMMPGMGMGMGMMPPNSMMGMTSMAQMGGGGGMMGGGMINTMPGMMGANPGMMGPNPGMMGMAGMPGAAMPVVPGVQPSLVPMGGAPTPHSPRAGSSSHRVGYTAAETCGLYGPVSGDYNHPRHLNCPVSVSQEYSISASALVALVDCALCHPPFQSKSHSVALQNHAPQDTL